MCELLNVNLANFYHYQKSKKYYDPLKDELLEFVKKIAESSDYTYGRE